MSGPQIDPALYRERDVVPIRRALLSVSDKTGIVELAGALSAAGVEIVSTGSTAARIAESGIPVTEAASVTGFPEMLDGRVKTLHPAIHGGLLADLRLAAHERQLAELGIAPFELVVVNLYPFVETVAQGAAPDAVIEQIDIGGPAMVRASAKNHANVAIVVDPARYPQIVTALAAGGTTLTQRRLLARDAFRHTADYDRAVAEWFQGRVWEFDPASGAAHADAEAGGQRASAERLDVSAVFDHGLRYGENSHQRAALYVEEGGVGIAQASQHGGKEMSYNNYVDAHAALRAAYDHDAPAVAIIKHANPCGIAVAATLADAHAKAHACDPVSAFGGVIAANRVVDRATAESIARVFTEVVVAPGYEPDALDVLRTKKNLRILELPAGWRGRAGRGAVEPRWISGGILVQEPDERFAPPTEWTLVAGEAADAATLADLDFAWRAVRAVKSNAILLAHDGASVGIGMGQVNRVDSCRLAVERANTLADGLERARGAVAASDAFFPFADGAEILIRAGVRAIAQPGGSVRDEEVVAAARDAGVTMYFTGERHFFH